MNKTTALLVIDMQLVGFDGKITPAIAQGDQLLLKVRQLINAARRAKAAIFYVQHCGWSGQPFAKDMHGWQIHPDIAPEKSDVVVEKTHSSAFEQTQLQQLLASKGIVNLITCGTQSEHCLSNTSLSGLDNGYKVYVASDAHGTVSTEADHAADVVLRQNNLLAQKGALVCSTDSLLEILA